MQPELRPSKHPGIESLEADLRRVKYILAESMKASYELQFRHELRRAVAVPKLVKEGERRPTGIPLAGIEDATGLGEC